MHLCGVLELEDSLAVYVETLGGAGATLTSSGLIRHLSIWSTKTLNWQKRSLFSPITLMHSEWPKLHWVLTTLNAKGLMKYFVVDQILNMQPFSNFSYPIHCYSANHYLDSKLYYYYACTEQEPRDGLLSNTEFFFYALQEKGPSKKLIILRN